MFIRILALPPLRILLLRHTCHQQKGASIKFSLGKEAKHPLVVPSSPKKPAAKEKKKTLFGTDSEKK
ncbi:hypothetical protein NECAME_05813 [Necator americanus]|uniref:Uncharacterized protein n=1 Tax=Necator americanus TaxID=51031 RepID=W2U0F5_NECAM|nr:hypothetical protein NECAME_05813 [Necator americanus]ETN86821.1 hypothetical protein NECAME_05813 [Necator americanus]